MSKEAPYTRKEVPYPSKKAPYTSKEAQYTSRKVPQMSKEALYTKNTHQDAAEPSQHALKTSKHSTKEDCGNGSEKLFSVPP